MQTKGNYDFSVNKSNQLFQRIAWQKSQLQSNWIVRMDVSFNLFSFLVVISIIFVDDKLLTYQMDEITRGRVSGMTESDRNEDDVA